jgi:hypothetical protein
MEKQPNYALHFRYDTRHRNRFWLDTFNLSTPPSEQFMQFNSIIDRIGVTPESAGTAFFEAIDLVWSGHEMQFALLRNGDSIYIGYYDPARQLTLARRSVRSGHYKISKIDTWAGWDSHNSIALGLDRNGRLHVSGNMHNDPLHYWIAQEADSISRFDRVVALHDPQLERSISYPHFLQHPDGDLVFHYRKGKSGSGSDFLVKHNSNFNTFEGILGSALIDGEGKRSGYALGPLRGPDGNFHLAWLWRASALAESTHALSYARSPDLKNWETSDGRSITSPLTFGNCDMVDPIPINGGAINNNILMDFDHLHRPIIAYHKYDHCGRTQIFLARPESGGWRIIQTTNWEDFRWEITGPGTLRFRLRLLTLHRSGSGFRLAYIRDDVQQEIFIEVADLSCCEEALRTFARQDAVLELPELPEHMVYHKVVESWAPSTSPYSLVWATQRENQDFARSKISQPSTLYLIFPRASSEWSKIRSDVHDCLP